MSDAFDPYRKWLGIPTAEQPPNHYRLLAIDRCEADPDVIETAADLRMSHLRTYQTGMHSALSQRLLNEVAAAKLCLLDPVRKAAYDAALRQQLEATQPAPQSPPAAEPHPQASPIPAVDPQPPAIVVTAVSTKPAPSGRTPLRMRRAWWQSAMLATGVAVLVVATAFYAFRKTREDSRKSAASKLPVESSRKTPRQRRGDPLKKPPAPAHTAENEDQAVAFDTASADRARKGASPNSATAAAAGGPPPSPEMNEDGPRRSLFDVLGSIDLNRDTVHGNWQFAAGKLISPATRQARIELPCEVPAEYVLDALVEFDSLAQGFVIGLIVNEAQTLAVLDGWNNAISGLLFVDGRDANVNPTSRRGDFLLDGRPNRVVCEVRKSGVRVTCNDTLIVNWRSGTGALSMPAGWEVRSPRHLFLASDGAAYRVTKAELRPLAGEPASAPLLPVATAMPIDKEEKKPPWNVDKALQAAELEAETLFGDEYRRSTTAEQQLALARKQLDRARWGQDADEVRYVIAKRALALATSHGDAVTACRAWELVAAMYDSGDLLEARAKAVSKALQTPVSDEMAWANTLLALSVAVGAADAERFDLLDGLLKPASETARAQLKSETLYRKLQALTSLRVREQRRNIYKQSLGALQKQPDGKNANLAAGRHEMLVRGDWKSGGARWARVVDRSLDELLRLDSEAYRTPDIRLAAARAWWTAASTAGKSWKHDYQLQAKYWCQRTAGASTAEPTAADARWMNKALGLPGYARSRFRSGIAAEYYNGADFQELRAWRVDRHIDWSFGDRSAHPKLSHDWFSIRWTGWLRPPVAGKWRIFLHTDNGVRLWIDGRKVLDFWNADVHDHSIDLQLTDQPHRFRLEYSEFWGAAVAEWSWCLLEGGERGRQPVPPEAFLYEQGSPYNDPVVPAEAGVTAPPTDSPAKLLTNRAPLPRATCNPCEFAAVVGEVAPGFTTSLPSDPRGLTIESEHFGRTGVLRTHPVDGNRPCMLTSTVDVPAGKKTSLALDVSHHPYGDWQLVVKANGQQLYDGVVGPNTVQNGWQSVSVDLTAFAGNRVNIELHNQANDWRWEFGYWGSVQIVSR